MEKKDVMNSNLRPVDIFIVLLLVTMLPTIIGILVVKTIDKEPITTEYKGHTYLKFNNGIIHDPECKKCYDLYD